MHGLTRSRRAALLTAAGVAVAAGPAAGSAHAGVFVCVPATAGAAVTSGGSDGTCAAGKPVELPESRADQQTLMSALPYLSFKAAGIGGKPTITFKGANVQLVNGAGATMSKNGTGNLVLGYNENPGSQTGSHSLWTGYAQTVTGAGAVVTGFDNKATGDLSTVAGGAHNSAPGFASLVGGGWYQNAGDFGTALGGRSNKANGYFDTAIGGENNVAKGGSSTAAGGYYNVAAGRYSVAAGGCSNVAGAGTLASYDGCPSDNSTYGAVGDAASVFGGKFNHAAATMTVASGGERNKATGRLSTLNGGKGRAVTAPGATINGGIYWVRISSTGTKVAESGGLNAQPIQTYQYGGGWKLAYIPGLNLANCSVSVEPDASDATIGYRYVTGEYVYVQVLRNGQGYDASGLMVSASCPQ